MLKTFSLETICKLGVKMLAANTKKCAIKEIDRRGWWKPIINVVLTLVDIDFWWIMRLKVKKENAKVGKTEIQYKSEGLAKQV